MSVFFELQLAIRAKRTCDVQKSLPQLQALQDPLDEFSTTVVVTSFKEAVNYHRQFRRVLKVRYT
ncbi:MAG: hypothetical protein KVP17_001185 [Porospora cf. gigantea B]|uniref:uncharacterized protein n=1 Tax=Porospora cf. gigantea B TaxID=2853592 RepID=UPI003571F776|nr:MAG: hypothetical protein KVP17_001185 [Porospora cf. gigantea B]